MAAASDRDSVLSLITNQKDGLSDLLRIVDRLGENFKQILQSISSDERLQILQISYKKTGWTILHYAVYKSDAETVEMILDCVSEEERYILLSAPFKQELTLIHYACFYDRSRILSLLISLLKNETWYKLLQITCALGFTPLHLSASRGHTQAIGTIADSLTAQHLIHLLRINDDYGGTPLQLAEYDGKHAAAKLLKDYQTKALIDVALQQADQTAREKNVQEIVSREPLTVGQIEELSPYSSQYVIPHNQTKTKRYGLILYSAEDRHGADQEADNFKDALETAGCDVIKLQWSSTSELDNMIDSSLTGILDDCSLLIAAVMTHGYRGALRGSEGSEIPINDILFQLDYTMPKMLPLVMIVQACQVYTTHGIAAVQPEDYGSDPATPSHVIDPHNNKHIVLRRQHTVLLLATVTGGEAIRGAFTGALADQIRAADGKTDIYTMFNCSCSCKQNDKK